MYKTESFKPDDFKPARFESKGTITLRGNEIPYHTVSEDNVFYGKDGKAIASIFSYSYFRSDVEDASRRPVVFAYNGGPGSSSMYVHAGFLGARRITYGEPDRPSAFGPFEVIDNPDCLLDIADLVLVDPVGVGYGVLIDEEEGKNFLGIEEDAEALLSFIEAWTRRYNRSLSPKYLVGESYGCTRSATAAGIAANGGKERAYGVAFDGIVMIKEAVNGTTLVDVDAKGPSYIKRLRTIDKSFPADALICQLSTNDATQGMPLGKVTDERDPEAFDLQTIAGAMEYIISYAKSTWNCPVLFYSGTRFISDLYQNMTELLPVMQEKWNIGLIDLWNHEEMYTITDEAYSLYMFDPIHPTRAGYLEWWTPVFEKDLTAFFEK